MAPLLQKIPNNKVFVCMSVTSQTTINLMLNRFKIKPKFQQILILKKKRKLLRLQSSDRTLKKCLEPSGLHQML